MSKRSFVKGNLHRDDYHRAILTDTTPDELPIIISNDGFYSNLKSLVSKSADTKRLISGLIYPEKEKFFIPYRYRVTKDSTSTRRLSLIHPAAQAAVSNFYWKYAELICFYNDRSEFSIRTPIKVGTTYFFRSSVSEKNKYKSQGIDTLQFEKRVRNPASYFAYRGHDR